MSCKNQAEVIPSSNASSKNKDIVDDFVRNASVNESTLQGNEVDNFRSKNTNSDESNKAETTVDVSKGTSLESPKPVPQIRTDDAGPVDELCIFVDEVLHELFRPSPILQRLRENVMIENDFVGELNEFNQSTGTAEISDSSVNFLDSISSNTQENSVVNVSIEGSYNEEISKTENLHQSIDTNNEEQISKTEVNVTNDNVSECLIKIPEEGTCEEVSQELQTLLNSVTVPKQNENDLNSQRISSISDSGIYHNIDQLVDENRRYTNENKNECVLSHKSKTAPNIKKTCKQIVPPYGESSSEHSSNCRELEESDFYGNSMSEEVSNEDLKERDHHIDTFSAHFSKNRTLIANGGSDICNEGGITRNIPARPFSDEDFSKMCLLKKGEQFSREEDSSLNVDVNCGNTSTISGPAEQLWVSSGLGYKNKSSRHYLQRASKGNSFQKEVGEHLSAPGSPEKNDNSPKGTRDIVEVSVHSQHKNVIDLDPTQEDQQCLFHVPCDNSHSKDNHPDVEIHCSKLYKQNGGSNIRTLNIPKSLNEDAAKKTCFQNKSSAHYEKDYPLSDIRLRSRNVVRSGIVKRTKRKANTKVARKFPLPNMIGSMGVTVHTFLKRMIDQENPLMENIILVQKYFYNIPNSSANVEGANCGSYSLSAVENSEDSINTPTQNMNRSKKGKKGRRGKRRCKEQKKENSVENVLEMSNISPSVIPGPTMGLRTQTFTQSVIDSNQNENIVTTQKFLYHIPRALPNSDAANGDFNPNNCRHDEKDLETYEDGKTLPERNFNAGPRQEGSSEERSLTLKDKCSDALSSDVIMMNRNVLQPDGRNMIGSDTTPNVGDHLPLPNMSGSTVGVSVSSFMKKMQDPENPNEENFVLVQKYLYHVANVPPNTDGGNDCVLADCNRDMSEPFLEKSLRDDKKPENTGKGRKLIKTSKRKRSVCTQESGLALDNSKKAAQPLKIFNPKKKCADTILKRMEESKNPHKVTDKTVLKINTDEECLLYKDQTDTPSCSNIQGNIWEDSEEDFYSSD